MARIRTIKPDLTLDEELAALGFAARYFFVNLLCHCDKAGRCEDRPKMLQARILPWDKIDVDKLLSELSPKFLIRYSVGGREYIQVRNFEKHQKPHPREPESVIPQCPKEQFEKAVKKNGQAMPGKVDTGYLILDTGILDTGDIAPRPMASEPPVLIYPTHGKDKEWPLLQSFVDSLKSDFPAVDVLSECRSARAWCESNPLKRKTASGMKRFLVAWMTRQQNRGQATSSFNQQQRIVGHAAPVKGKYGD